MSSMTFSHVAICVSDIERSTRFYTQALGFVFHHSFVAAAPFGTLLELDCARIRIAFLHRPGVPEAPMIELFSPQDPGVTGATQRRAMNHRGLTHLCLIYDDLTEVLARVIEHGGIVFPQTKVETVRGEILFCADPDGIRIELWRRIG
jgi:catechol 2,3-dioxygenase-like lactoylglutathione lyase family enzyme